MLVLSSARFSGVASSVLMRRCQHVSEQGAVARLGARVQRNGRRLDNKAEQIEIHARHRKVDNLAFAHRYRRHLGRPDARQLLLEFCQ